MGSFRVLRALRRCAAAGRPRGLPTRPAPLAGSGHQGNPARGTRGMRGARRQPEGPARRAETSRGRQTLPPPPPLEGQRSQRDKPLGAAEAVGILAVAAAEAVSSLPGLALEQTLLTVSGLCHVLLRSVLLL